jgi:hypothetical protein
LKFNYPFPEKHIINPFLPRLYLENGPGIVGETFDLFHVYRYTHGDPEAVDSGGWFEQLHKSLFDGPELNQLLKNSGFSSSLVFYYAYPGEEKTPVNCGFLASRSEHSAEDLKKTALSLIEEIAAPKVILSTIRFLS